MSPKLALLTLTLASLAGCAAKDPTEGTASPASSPAAQEAVKPQAAVELPTLDTRSPDNVVKSYWAIRDWEREHIVSIFPKMVFSDDYRHYVKVNSDLATGEYLAKLERDAKTLEEFPGIDRNATKQVIQRDIVEVKTESETRAVVLAKIKNITPIPSGVKLDEFNAPRREYGLDVRYIVEKEQEGWRLSQAWSRNKTDIDLDNLASKDKQTGGWSKVWPLPTPSSGTSQYDFSATEP